MNANDEIYRNLQEGLAKVMRENSSSDAVEFAVKHVVHTAGQSSNEQTITILLKVIESFVTSFVMPARLILVYLKYFMP